MKITHPSRAGVRPSFPVGQDVTEVLPSFKMLLLLDPWNEKTLVQVHRNKPLDTCKKQLKILPAIANTCQMRSMF